MAHRRSIGTALSALIALSALGACAARDTAAVPGHDSRLGSLSGAGSPPVAADAAGTRRAIDIDVSRRREIYASLPRGTQVYRERAFIIKDAGAQHVFPSYSKLTRYPDKLVVSVDGKEYGYSALATVERSPTYDEYYVRPGKPKPRSLQGRSPDLVIKTKPSW